MTVPAGRKVGRRLLLTYPPPASFSFLSCSHTLGKMQARTALALLALVALASGERGRVQGPAERRRGLQAPPRFAPLARLFLHAWQLQGARWSVPQRLGARVGSSTCASLSNQATSATSQPQPRTCLMMASCAEALQALPGACLVPCRRAAAPDPPPCISPPASRPSASLSNPSIPPAGACAARELRTVGAKAATPVVPVAKTAVAAVPAKAAPAPVKTFPTPIVTALQAWFEAAAAARAAYAAQVQTTVASWTAFCQSESPAAAAAAAAAGAGAARCAKVAGGRARGLVVRSRSVQPPPPPHPAPPGCACEGLCPLTSLASLSVHLPAALPSALPCPPLCRVQGSQGCAREGCTRGACQARRGAGGPRGPPGRGLRRPCRGPR